MKRQTVIRIIAVFALGLAGCGTQKGALQERSIRSRPPLRVKPSLWTHFEASGQWKVLASYPSFGHARSYGWATVRVSPGAEQAYLDLVPGSAVPPGTIIVQALSRAEGTSEEVLFAMEKAASGWIYTQLNSDGGVETDPELMTAAACPRCHAEGVSDELFGIPHAP